MFPEIAREEPIGASAAIRPRARHDTRELQVEIGVDDGDIEVDGDVDDAALVRVGGEQWRLTLLGLENKIRFFTQVPLGPACAWCYGIIYNNILLYNIQNSIV